MSQKEETISLEEYNKKMGALESVEDVQKFVRDLVAPVLQKILDAELDNHLGYKKHDPEGYGSGNSRNGHYAKKLKTQNGTMDIKIPRDRMGSFNPQIVPKFTSTDKGIEERIIAMYARGMTTLDINEHIGEIYGVEASKQLISHITDKVFPEIREWQSRPLASVYAIVYLDAVHFKVRDGGKIESKAAYIMLGITEEGMKEILGIWVGGNEGAKYWLGLLNEIHNRGVKDMSIACVDGLAGFSDAIATVFPETEIQRCIVR
jgi:putative transposase